MNGLNLESNHIIEYVIFIIIILASTSISTNEKIIENDNELEIDSIQGTVILSTRAAMDALGLDENIRTGAIATVNLTVNSIESEGCNSCNKTPVGIQIIGDVEIQNIRNQMGGLGRVEGILSITYLKEYIDSNFVSKEWFTIEWNASGGEELDTFTHIMIHHDPPKWELNDRYKAAFITIDENRESRTGPWLLAQNLIDNSLNVQGCLPNSLSCEKALNPDINLTSTKKQIEAPIILSHYNDLIQLTNLETTNATPEKNNKLRELFKINNEVNIHNIFCNENEEDILALKTWEIEVVNNNIIAPMSLWLDILDLPSSTFIQTNGFWTEIDYESFGCASISDTENNIKLVILKK
ncbi:MAG: hypothetical protein CMB48_05240 [Euryarchaeota archaeon]|nr:hypothetical protein [Euryarchaeota archaeon]